VSLSCARKRRSEINVWWLAERAPALKASDVSFIHECSLKMEQKPDISSSGAAKAEADPAYVNLKVKQQVALCRGSISICIDTVFRMAQSPISELSAAHNSKRFAACSSALIFRHA
jgi:acetylglutamate synthase